MFVFTYVFTVTWRPAAPPHLHEAGSTLHRYKLSVLALEMNQNRESLERSLRVQLIYSH